MDFIWIIFLAFNLVDCFILMSVDLGSRFVKNGILRSGYQGEIVYDDEGRKFSAVISFFDTYPKLGEDAIRACLKHPRDTFMLFTDLLFKDDDFISTWRTFIPHLKYLEDSSCFEDSSKNEHQLEELIAMMLLTSIKRTINFADGLTIDASVLTLPNFIKYSERQAILNIAESVGLNISAIIPVNLAAAFGFGLFHTNEFEKNPMYILLIDIGAVKTQMSIFELSHKKYEHQIDPIPSLITLSTAYDRTLGAWSIQRIIRDVMIDQIDQKIKFDYNPRAMNKLFVTSEKVLSSLAFKEIVDITIENIQNGMDFDFHITKDEIEQKSAEIVERSITLMFKVLEDAKISESKLDQIIPTGGGSRIFLFEKGILGALNRSLSTFDRRINIDEGISLGAAYYGATLTQYFKMEKFNIQDRISYTAKIIIPSAKQNGNESVLTLFNIGTIYPKRKTVTLRNHRDDFIIAINIIENELISFNMSLSIFGVKKAQSNSTLGTNHIGVKIVFKIDETQQLSIEKVEYHVKSVEVTSTFQGFKNKFLHTFGLNKGDVSNTTTAEASNLLNKTDVNENMTLTNSTSDEHTNQTTPLKKFVLHSTPLKFQLHNTTDFDLIDSIRKKLHEYEKAEQMEHERSRLQNDIESWLYDWSDKITIQDILTSIKSTELKELKDAISINRVWFDEFGYNANIKELQDRMVKLDKLVVPITTRLKEHKALTKSLDLSKRIFNITDTFLNMTSNLIEIDNSSEIRTKPLLQSEVDKLERNVNRTKIWLNDLLIIQNNISLSDDSVLLSSDINTKISKITQQLDFLSNKIKRFIPPPPKSIEPEFVSNFSSSDMNSTTISLDEIDQDHASVNYSSIPPIRDEL